MTKPPYRGRFAPSPSGPLHFGSLLCALASYLDAKAQHGHWLLRIEDIDPPREQPGAAEAICQSLQAHGLLWDESRLYQSERAGAYREKLHALDAAGMTYPCNCTRKRLGPLAGNYDGHCKIHTPPAGEPTAQRLNLSHVRVDPFIAKASRFVDAVQGEQNFPLASTGDFVVHRKDGLFAYQLAVVVDDIFQGITHVVRGIDLLDTSAQQALLFYLFGSQPPRYAHVPIALDRQGKKLSKQNHAPAIDNRTAKDNILRACQCLNIDLTHCTHEEVEQLLTLATEQWNMQTLHKQKAFSFAESAYE